MVKLRTGPPSASVRVDAVCSAAVERFAGAMGSMGSGWCSWVKVSGVHAFRRCQTTQAASMQITMCARIRVSASRVAWFRAKVNCPSAMRKVNCLAML